MTEENSNLNNAVASQTPPVYFEKSTYMKNYDIKCILVVYYRHMQNRSDYNIKVVAAQSQDHI